MNKLFKSQRVCKRAHYSEVLSSEGKVVFRNILLKFKPHTAGDMRLGLVVSKKVGCAVVRNKVKRLLRESFRQLPAPTRAKSFDIVVIARHSAKFANYASLSKQLQSGVTRVLARKSL